MTKGLGDAIVRGMAEPKIRIRGLTKSFGGRTVLAGIDLDIEAGTNVVLFGPSASGKTVLAKCIVGLIKPDSGSIQIDGVEITTMSAGEREAVLHKVGVLFQNGALFDSLKVWNNIAFGLLSRREMDEKQARELAVKTLASVGLTPDTADLLPSELSGGMQKRVALARAIVGTPEIVILDSPTDGLDPIVTTHIDALIVRALKQLNAAALTITQDIDSGRKIADRAAFLFEGRIRWQGPMAEIERAADPELKRFFNRAADVTPLMLQA